VIFRKPKNLFAKQPKACCAPHAPLARMKRREKGKEKIEGLFAK